MLGMFSLRIRRIAIDARSGIGQEVDAFRFQHLARVRKARLNVGRGQMVVLSQHLLDGPASPQQVDDKLDRDARALHDRLADLGVIAT